MLILLFQQQTGPVAEATESLIEAILTLGGNLSYSETWLGLTLALLVLEIFTAGFFMGALALATLVSAGTAALGLPREGQLIVFAVVSIASLVFVRPLCLRVFAPPKLETNANSLVDQKGVVIDSVPANGHGRVRLANEEWRATASEHIGVGDKVRVVEVTGNTLTVARV